MIVSRARARAREKLADARMRRGLVYADKTHDFRRLQEERTDVGP